MVALNSSFPGTSVSTNTCNLSFDAATKTWKCVAGTNKTRNTQASFHFGCREISLAPGASITTPDQTGNNPSFVGKEAKDFQVSYADVFDLTEGTFDSVSCNTLGCFGADTDTNFDSVLTRAGGTGFWILQKVPITDPFVLWQELNGTRHRREYAPFSADLSVPSEFPAIVPGLGRTSPETQPPLTLTQDLNLWDIYTMSSPPETFTPVFIQPFAAGSATEFRVTAEVNPREARIAGESMGFGTMTIRRPAGVTIPEGVILDLSIAFLDPANPRVEFWEQDVNAIQDTEPPVVADHTEVLTDTFLDVSVTAFDLTTAPLSANLWYSLDEGRTWAVEPLVPTIDPLEFSRRNNFSTTVPLDIAPVNPVRFFYNVQDCVGNTVWFGIGILNPITIFSSTNAL